jgi:TonB family protein
MKTPPVFLVSAALFLGACSTPTTRISQADNNPAVRSSNKVTKWGELPSYEPQGHHFEGLKFPHFGNREIRAEAKLDILVNPDGTVQDVTIFESCGDPSLDRALAATFKNARYSLQLGPNDPAPYVVRFTMGLKTEAGDTRPINLANHSNAGP